MVPPYPFCVNQGHTPSILPTLETSFRIREIASGIKSVSTDCEGFPDDKLIGESFWQIKLGKMNPSYVMPQEIHSRHLFYRAPVASQPLQKCCLVLIARRDTFFLNTTCFSIVVMLDSYFVKLGTWAWETFLLFSNSFLCICKLLPFFPLSFLHQAKPSLF